MKEIIEQDRKILKENGFGNFIVHSDGFIRLPKVALNAGIRKVLRKLGIKSEIVVW